MPPRNSAALIPPALPAPPPRSGNPLCEAKNYRRRVISAVPGLEILDMLWVKRARPFLGQSLFWFRSRSSDHRRALCVALDRDIPPAFL